MSQNLAASQLQAFLIYATAQIISVLGSSLTGFAMGVWIYQDTNSVTTLAINSLAYAIPGLLLSPLAGTLVDRWDRRWVLLCCDVVNALNILALALLLWSGQLQIWQIYLTTAIASANLAFLSPAFTATIPLLVPKEQLTRFNGFFGAGVAVSQVIAPALGGILMVTIGAHNILLIDFASYFVGITPLLFIRLPKPELSADAVAARGSLLREMMYGWSYLKARPGLLSLLLFLAVANFLVAIVSTLVTPLALSVASPAVLGTVMAVGGVGMLLGTLTIGIWGGPKKRIWGVLWFLMGVGLFIVLAGLRPWVPLFMIAAFGFFFCQPIIGTCIQTIFQMKVAQDVQGRIFALSGLISGMAMPLGFLITGPLADNVFEPLLSAQGALSSSMGAWIGVGPGRGIALMFILAGIGTMLVAGVGFAYPHLRRIEEELPDAALEKTPEEIEIPSAIVGEEISYPAHPKLPIESMKPFEGRIMKIIRRVLIVVVILFLVLILTVGGGLIYAIRAPMPSVAGTFKVPGLIGSVQVYRDHLGVPHIYADSSHDLFFAQGYVQAQDRFAQMEFARRFAAGRLSEIFGATTLEADRFVRILGWSRVVEKEVDLLDNDTRSILQAFADGVNAYANSHGHLGLEFELMGITGTKYTPDPWTVADSIGWLKVMALNMNSNMDSELRNVQLLQTMNEKTIRELWPTTFKNSPLIVPEGVDYTNLNTTALKTSLTAIQSLQLAHIGTGSNSWALSGKLTDTGKPYLANDPHLGIQMPSIWYEVGLHCNTLSAGCPYNVTGVSFVSMPGVIIGHNQRISWGFTNLFADVQDLYLERVNPNNPNQYAVDDQWVDMDLVTETIRVRGQLPSEEPTGDSNPPLSGAYDAATDFTQVKLSVRLTRHGPVTDDYNPQTRKFNGAIGSTQVPDQHVTTLRWTALEPTTAVRMIYKLDRAQNWDEFRQAMRDFDAPTQNVIYADVDGNIGFQAPGKIPIRAKGDGQFPVPGWNSEYEWDGYIPFEKLPFAYNPPEGYIVAANNAVVSSDYPYLISLEWDPGTRAGRIVEMIKARAGQPITRNDIEQMQSDVLNLTAQKMIPYLAALRFDDPELQAAANELTAWDSQQRLESGPAALYAILWVEILKTAFAGKLPSQQWPSQESVIQLMADPANAWWDDKTTPNVVEQRDELLRRAFTAAVADAKSLMGPNRKDWAWGKLQTATFSNGILGFIPVVGQLFNRGPFPVPGGATSINAIGEYIGENPNAADPTTYQVITLPSVRTIIDLNNFGNSLIIHTTGQSGHPYTPHYDDMIELWRQNKYHPQLWERSTVESATEAQMTLIP